MARALYGYTPADFAVAEDATNSDALIAAASTLDIYDEPGGTAQTDLLDADGNAATQVVSAAGDTITFQGPDDWDKDLYGTPDSGTTWYRFPPSPNPLVDRVAALEAASSAPDLNDIGDVNTTGVSDADVLAYVDATSTWAPTTLGAAALSNSYDDLDDKPTGTTPSADSVLYVPAVWTGSAWPSRPTVLTGQRVAWYSITDVDATAPTAQQQWDTWWRHPNSAVTS